MKTNVYSSLFDYALEKVLFFSLVSRSTIIYEPHTNKLRFWLKSEMHSPFLMGVSNVSALSVFVLYWLHLSWLNRGTFFNRHMKPNRIWTATSHFRRSIWEQIDTYTKIIIDDDEDDCDYYDYCEMKTNISDRFSVKI